MTPSSLISRVEEGEGADRELNCLIFAKLNGWSYPLVGAAATDFTINGAFYTTSLDAVVSLIEQKLPGYGHCYATGWDAEGNCGGFVSPERAVDLTKAVMGVAKSPARALLAAALKAISSLENSPAGLADANNGDQS